jgi:hypothetical protein
MKTWDGLNAEEIASIPRDEYCFQKIERILRERNELKVLSDEEIPIMTILQNAQSVPLGSPIFETDEEYEKLKKIVIAAVRWSIK